MPPKKGKKEKEAPTSAAPEKGGSPDNNENSSSDAQYQEQKIDELLLPSSIATDTFQKCLDISLQKIFDNHIAKYTDEYAVASSLENISEAIFDLFPIIEKPETPRSPTPVAVPREPHQWASYTYRNCGDFFQLSIVDEADNLVEVQGKSGQRSRKNNNLIPAWLQKPVSVCPTPSVSVSLSSSSMSSFTKLKQQQQSPKIKSPKCKQTTVKRSLSKDTRSDSSLVPKISIMTPMEVDQFNINEKIHRIQEARDAAIKDKMKNQISKTQINPARMRQFNRRSAQKKKELTGAGIKKIPVPPGSGQNTQRLPSVSIVDPRAEALDLRRRQLKMGKLRPQTESEVKLITIGSVKKHSSKSPKKKLPAIRSEQALRNEEMTNYANNNNVTKLPETLIDSLAISDGTNGLLENLKMDDFDGLNSVQTEIGGQC